MSETQNSKAPVRKIRVAFYHFNALVPDAGGVERVATTLSMELEKKGVECFGIYRFGELPKDLSSRHFRIPDDNLASETNARAIAGFLKENEIDVIINLSAILNNSSLCAVEGARIAGVPHVAVYHNTFELPLLTNPHTARMMSSAPLRWILRELLAAVQKMPGYKGANYIARHSSACITLGNSYIPEFRKFVSRKHPNVDYIYNPFYMSEDPEPGKPVTREKMALFVGRLSPQKDLDRLLKAWQLADRRDWILSIVGDGPEKERLQNLANELGIADTVRFEGHQNPVSWYKRASIFCMTSAYEGFPMTLIECQAYGCVPVVMDRFTAAREIVETGRNGVLIKNPSPESYAAALSSLISDTARADSLRDGCIADTSRFALGPIVMKWYALICSLIKR